MNTLPDIYRCGMLPDTMVNELEALTPELAESWGKRQVFRTETEMRVSVLSDGDHPTRASKYWQAVREQTMMLDTLADAGFRYRRNEVALKRYQKRLEDATDPLDREETQIEVDECLFRQASLRQEAEDRMRELKLWSQLKAELDDGSFDTQNVNTHQMESLRATLINRKNSLTPGSSQAEVLNVIGVLNTLERVAEERKTLAGPEAPIVPLFQEHILAGRLY